MQVPQEQNNVIVPCQDLATFTCDNYLHDITNSSMCVRVCVRARVRACARARARVCVCVRVCVVVVVVVF